MERPGGGLGLDWVNSAGTGWGNKLVMLADPGDYISKVFRPSIQKFHRWLAKKAKGSVPLARVRSANPST